jgi:hypothetical protein
MRYRVSGAWLSTGMDAIIDVDAADESEARRIFGEDSDD